MTDHAAIVRTHIRGAGIPQAFAALDALVAERDEAKHLALRLNEQLNGEWKKRVAAEAERDEARELLREWLTQDPFGNHWAEYEGRVRAALAKEDTDE